MAVRFGVAPEASAARAGVSGGVSLSTSRVGEVVLTGSNGTLTITDISFIVDEFKLERGSSACDESSDEGDGDGDDGCATFEAAPGFVRLPLAGDATVALSEPAPAGTYAALKFETKAARTDELLAEVRTAFADWPGESSMVVVGSFLPAGSVTPVPFRVYFHAEVKIEESFEPALVLVGDAASVTVEADPRLWFVEGGLVTDLSSHDFAATGTVLKFEAKMADGFTKIELD